MSYALKPELIAGAIFTEIFRQKPDREINAGVVDKVVEAARLICEFASASYWHDKLHEPGLV